MKKEGDESEEANSIYTGLDLQGGVKLAHYHNMISIHVEYAKLLLSTITHLKLRFDIKFEYHTFN